MARPQIRIINFNKMKETNCRICMKMFCCQKCRFKHEEQIHEITTDCDICIFGKVGSHKLIKASPWLTDHVQSVHFPMHCSFCNAMFYQIELLINHNKCSGSTLLTISGTPLTPNSDNSFDPHLGATPFKTFSTYGSHKAGSITTVAITSTPLQETSDNQIPTEFTLNDNHLKIAHKSILKSNSGLSESRKSEKKVTFSETGSLSPNANITNETNYLDLQNQKYQEESTCTFYSMSEENEDFQKNSFQDNGENSILDDTLWESASNISDLNESVSFSMNKFIKMDKPNTESNALCEVFFEESEQKKKVTSLNDLCVEQTTNIRKVVRVTLPKKGDSSSSSLWISMKKAVNSMMHNFSTGSKLKTDTVLKRFKSEEDISDEDINPSKRRKLVEIKCRRPLRPLEPMYESPPHLRRRLMVDKSTQVDEHHFN